MPIYNMPKKFKKLTLQYSYLQLEKEEVDETCLSVEKEIRDYLEEYYPDHYETFYKSSPPGTTQPTPEPEPAPVPEPKPEPESVAEDSKEEDEELISSPPKNKDLRKLYRKIAEKTHPDKLGNDKYAQLFSEASHAYATNDIATLLNLAGILNIELLELSPESLILLENNIKTLAVKIYKKKQTIAWAWHQSNSEEQREDIIKQVLIAKGIKL